MQTYRPFLLLFFIVTLCVFGAGASLAATVENLRFGREGDSARVVIDLDRPAPWRAFLLDNPARLVIDLPDSTLRAAPHGTAQNILVKTWRSGTLPDDNVTRIVFDLHRHATVGKAFALPATAGAQDRIVLDLVPATPATFHSQLGRVHGNAVIKSAQKATAQIPATPAAAPILVAPAALSVLAAPAAGRTGVAATRPVRKPVYAQRTKVIVIDAGHGGGDPGAIASGIQEKNLTLALARELARQLHATGRYKVVLTRDKDTYIKLRDRLALSRAAKGDLFISLHADKIGRSNVRGASVYTLSENASDAETARLAESENNAGIVAGVDLAAESQDVADILLDLAMRDKMNSSNLFADILVYAFQRNDIRLLNNAHRSAGFAVLKAPDIPAVLVEMGFLSNHDEAKRLASASFQRQMAAAIVEGIDSYFRKMTAMRQDG